MRACTQIYKLSLLIETDHRVFRQILDQFHFVWLLSFFHKSNRLCPGFLKTFQPQAFLDDLFHLRLNLLQIFICKRSLTVHIVIEAVRNRRSDCQFHLRIEALDRLSHNMRSGVMESCTSAFITKCQNIYLSVFFHYCTQIHSFPVYLSRTGRSGQSFAQIKGNVIDRHGVIILFYRAIF